MDYWQEMLLHSCATGIGQFLYFNPSEFGGISIAQHDLLQAVLEECDTMVGCQDRRWVKDSNIRFRDGFILVSLQPVLPARLCSCVRCIQR